MVNRFCSFYVHQFIYRILNIFFCRNKCFMISWNFFCADFI